MPQPPSGADGLPALPGPSPGDRAPERGPVEVWKLRRDGTLRIAYQGELIGRPGGRWVVATAWAGRIWQGPYTIMHPGDPCVEYYRPGGHAVVLRLMGAGGELKGFYVDLAAAVQAQPGPPASIRYRDLVLDAFVTPSGAIRLLDVEEFLDWLQTEATPREVADVVAGLGELIQDWSSGSEPFAALASPAA